MLNKDTVKEYLDQIPYYDNNLDKYYFDLLAHKGDYIRITLLSYFGGVWVDYSSIFMKDLSWVSDINELKNTNEIRNIYGD